MSAGIGDQLAEFATQIKLENIPKETIEFAKALILKTVAGMVAGSRFPAGKKIAELVRTRKQSPEVGVIGYGFKTSPWEAVLAHGVFAHASELEDDRFTAEGGGSWDIGVLPVTLVLAEKNGLSGKEFLEASVVGLEVHCRTCNFPTAHLGLQMVPGAIGPAAGAAKAIGLSTGETAAALGIAMSGAPLISLNFGTDAHYFESAMQSLHAVIAAEAARVGMTSNPEIGRCLRYWLGKERVNPDAMVNDLGNRWYFQEIWVKKYPCCFGAHRQIDSVFELMRENNLSFEQIRELEVHISRVDRVLDRPEPRNLGDLQFSYHHILSAAMIDKDVNLGHFNDARVNDANLKPARAKVKVVVHDDWPTGTMESASLIVMKLKDGRQLSKERKYPIGSPQEPLTTEQFRGLYSKFTRGILPEEQIKSTADSILNLEKLHDVKALMDVLTFGSAGH